MRQEWIGLKSQFHLLAFLSAWLKEGAHCCHNSICGYCLSQLDSCVDLDFRGIQSIYGHEELLIHTVIAINLTLFALSPGGVCKLHPPD